MADPRSSSVGTSRTPTGPNASPQSITDAHLKVRALAQIAEALAATSVR